MSYYRLQRGAVVDTGILAARILLQIGAISEAFKLGGDSGIEAEIWGCTLRAVSQAKLYTTSFALAEALEGIIARRWPYTYTYALAAVVQLNSSGDLSEVVVSKNLAPAPLDLVDASLIEAARRTSLPLVTYDMRLWQYARGLADVLTIYELCA